MVCLLPARTDTLWFHRFALPHAAELRFFRGRLRFGEAQHSAPFPSVLVVFRPGTAAPVSAEQTLPSPLLVRSVLATPPAQAAPSPES